MAKKSITVNMEPQQLNELHIHERCTGIDRQVMIRLALRQYFGREAGNIPPKERDYAISQLKQSGEWVNH